MNRRNQDRESCSTWRAFAAILATVTLMTGATCRVDEQPARSSVIFFLADDLGWRDVGCFVSTLLFFVGHFLKRELITAP